MQATLEANLEQPWPGALRSSSAKRVLLCVDDIHVSSSCTAPGSSSVLEALRSLLTLDSYTTSSLVSCHVQNTSALASAITTLLPTGAAADRALRRMLALHLVPDRAETVLSSRGRVALLALCESFADSISAVVEGAATPSSPGRLAAVLASIMREAADLRSTAAQHRLFDIHAIRSILCRVHADLTQEPVDFVANAIKRSRTGKLLNGTAVMTLFGALADEQSWDELPRGQKTAQVLL